ncbi:DH domain-containing protein [Plasmodiophora brassicae]
MTPTVRRVRSAPILTGLPRVASAPQPNREAVLDELVMSERAYTRALAAVRDIFYTPILIRSLHPDQQLLSATEVVTIFRNVKQLAAHHEQILERLDDKVRRWGDRRTVGDVFAWAIDNGFPDLYRVFCGRQERALTVLARCSSTIARLRMFLAHAGSHPQCQGDTLRSMMMLPAQRLPKYAHMLQRLHDATPRDHKDRTLLSAAIGAIRATIDGVHEESLVEAADMQWAKIRRQMHGPLVRRLARMGSHAHLFLFRNTICLCDGDFQHGFYLVQTMAVDRLTALDALLAEDDPGALAVRRIDSDARLVATLAERAARPQWIADLLACIAGTDPGDVDRVGAMQCRTCSARFSIECRRVVCDYCAGFVCASCAVTQMDTRSLADDDRAVVTLCRQCSTMTSPADVTTATTTTTSAVPGVADDTHNDDDEEEEGQVKASLPAAISNSWAGDESPPGEEGDRSSSKGFLAGEARFVERFASLVSLVVTPLLTMSSDSKLTLMPRDDLHRVFGETLALLRVHVSLDEEMRLAPDDVESVLQKRMPLLQVYSKGAFVDHVDTSMRILDRATASRPRLQRFLDACLSQTSDITAISDLLEMPVQRLPAYISVLPSGSTTRAALVSMLSSIVQGLDTSDVRRRTRLALEQVSSQEIVESHLGTFHRKGPLLKNGKTVPKTCFLFDKVLLFCVPVAGRACRYRVRKRLDIGNDLVFVNDFVASSQAAHRSHSQTPIQIVRKRKSLIVHARDARDRLTWVSALRQCTTMHDPYSNTTGPPASCSTCKQFFTLTRRRRVCRACLEFICPSCAHGRNRDLICTACTNDNGVVSNTVK